MANSDNSNSALSMALGFMVGAVAGLAAGVLLAPKSGKETREQIAAKAHDAYDRAQVTAKHTYDEAVSKANTVAHKTKAAYREGKRAAKEAE